MRAGDRRKIASPKQFITNEDSSLAPVQLSVIVRWDSVLHEGRAACCQAAHHAGTSVLPLVCCIQLCRCLSVCVADRRPQSH